MKILLTLSSFIDTLTEKVARLAMWLGLLTVLISAANALVRKAFSMSSNALLEMQWYLFSALFLLGASYVLKKGAHVKIDILSSRLSAKAQSCIDLLGIIFFLIPTCVVVIHLTYPIFLNSLVSGEMSENAGGLIRWPMYLVVIVGFFFLLIQGISELIKTAYLFSKIKSDHQGRNPK